MGSSPKTSGAPLTRAWWRPVPTPLPTPGLPAVLAAKAADLANSMPPSTSRCPVKVLSTSTSQLASVPYSCVHVPMRAYTAARGVVANCLAKARMVGAGTPQREATDSGVKGDTAASTSRTPFTQLATRPSDTKPSANKVCTIAASMNTSPPGRMKWCASAIAAVSVRRGSITISRPPRACSALALPLKSGTVHMLPLLASGLAPITRRRSVRLMSGSATDSQCPNISPLASCLGIWSSVEAENTFLVPSARASLGK